MNNFKILTSVLFLVLTFLSSISYGAIQYNPIDTAVVITDPQNDFLSPNGVTWALVGKSVKENNTVQNLEELMKTAKQKGYPLFISPHYYYPTDHGWKFEGQLEKVMHEINMFDRKGPLNLDGFDGSGADWLEIYKPYINDSETIVSSPHKIYGPETNDLVLQLRKRGIDRVILGGMSANLCTESHMRELIEQGFDVIVVKDATAAAISPELGDGNKSALINYNFIANDVITTDEAVKRMKNIASSSSDERLLDKTIEAHGGLKKWKENKTLTYNMIGFPLTPQVAKPNKSTVDLVNRYNRIESEKFVVGFNGKEAWSIPGIEAIGLKPRFFSLGSSYFTQMPFVFADPGVVVTDAGTTKFQGKTFRLLKASYKKGTGYTSKDDFHLLIEPKSNRLALINHSVTEIGVDRVTWVFNEWQDVNGLIVPSKISFYEGWKPDNPGEGAFYTIKNVEFSSKYPDKSLYEPPADAKIDNSPSIH